MPDSHFPARHSDGTVAQLLQDPLYHAGYRAVRYLEHCRGICTAFRDQFGRYRIRVEGVGVEERPVDPTVLPDMAWLVPHDGEGRDLRTQLVYVKAGADDHVVHYAALSIDLALCGYPHDADQPPIRGAVEDTRPVTCLGCLACADRLTWDADEEVWRGYYPNL